MDYYVRIIYRRLFYEDNHYDDMSIEDRDEQADGIDSSADGSVLYWLQNKGSILNGV